MAYEVFKEMNVTVARLNKYERLEFLAKLEAALKELKSLELYLTNQVFNLDDSQAVQGELDFGVPKEGSN